MNFSVRFQSSLTTETCMYWKIYVWVSIIAIMAGIYWLESGEGVKAMAIFLLIVLVCIALLG